MFLSILLPTYNRSNNLKKNLENIIGILRFLNLCDKIDIIISNNCSSDQTDSICKTFIQQNSDIDIKYYVQDKNLGIELNSIFVLSKSESDYIMFLGDDDYFSSGYLRTVITLLTEKPDIGCILSSWQGIFPDGSIAPVSRDLDKSSIKFRAGVQSVCATAWRAHQLSGVTLKRDSLYKAYMEHKVHTIYPHIYLAAVTILQYNAYLLTEYPLFITQPSQNCKDWSYGRDGLINNKLEGYKCLPANWLSRNIIQIKCLIQERNVITGYANRSMNSFFILVKSVLLGKHILLLSRVFFFFYFIYLIIRGAVRHLFK